MTDRPSTTAGQQAPVGAGPATGPGVGPARHPIPERDEGEHLTTDALRAVQQRRLRRTLTHAYRNVPAYRRALDAAQVSPADFGTLDDLSHFPFTDKADLRADYPFGRLAVPRSQLRRVHASSGTSGRPTIVGYTARDLDVWALLMARSLRAAGVRPGHTVHVAYGYGLFTGGLGAHYGAERLGCTVVPASGGMTTRQVQLIRDLAPEVIMATPSYLLTLLDALAEQGVPAGETSLRIGVLGAEPWSEAMRAEIEGRTGMAAVDIYGLSELTGPGVAQECVETKDGLHLWEDHYFPEVVNPTTGAPVPDGTLGELVLTSLSREAMPLVRYRTGDLTRLLPGTARPTFRRMARVTGRCDDMIVLRGVNVYPTQVEEVLLSEPRLTARFELILTREDRLERLTVHAEARHGVSPEQRTAVADVIRTAIKDSIGVTVTVRITPDGTLPRSTGKARRVIDQR